MYKTGDKLTVNITIVDIDEGMYQIGVGKSESVCDEWFSEGELFSMESKAMPSKAFARRKKHLEEQLKEIQKQLEEMEENI